MSVSQILACDILREFAALLAEDPERAKGLAHVLAAEAEIERLTMRFPDRSGMFAWTLSMQGLVGG